MIIIIIIMKTYKVPLTGPQRRRTIECQSAIVKLTVSNMLKTKKKY